MKKNGKKCLIHKIRATTLYEMNRGDGQFKCVKCGKTWQYSSDLPKSWRYH